MRTNSWPLVSTKLALTCFALLFSASMHSQETASKSFKTGAKELSSLSRFQEGTFFVGGNLSFGETEGENDFLIANVDILEQEKNNINLSFVGGYFLNPLLSVGLRGKYSFTKNEQTLEADFLSTAFNAQIYKTQTLKNSLETHIFMRNYVPIGQSGNFYSFSETSIYYLRRNNYQRATRNPGQIDEGISTILSQTNGLGVGVSLGITYFSAKRFAFELQMGTTGLEVQWKDVEKDREISGSSRKTTFRDGLNFLNIQMGFTYYFKIIQ